MDRHSTQCRSGHWPRRGCSCGRWRSPGGSCRSRCRRRGLELVGIEPLRAAAELVALQLAKQVAQPIVLLAHPLALGQGRVPLRGEPDHERPERLGIVGQRIDRHGHSQSGFGPVGAFITRLIHSVAPTMSRSVARPAARAAATSPCRRSAPPAAPSYHAVGHRRPFECAALQPFPEHHQTRAVPRASPSHAAAPMATGSNPFSPHQAR